MNREMIARMIVAVLVLATAVTAAESPIDKGSLILGGSASFTSYGGDLYEFGGDGVSILEFSPSVGYFVAPSIEIGARVAIENVSIGSQSESSTAFGPEIGYYFKTGNRTEIKGSVYPYIKGFFLLNSSEGDKLTSFGGKGGIDFMLSNAVALDAGVTFQSDSYKPDGSSTSTSGTVMMVGAGITAFIF